MYYLATDVATHPPSYLSIYLQHCRLEPHLAQFDLRVRVHTIIHTTYCSYRPSYPLQAVIDAHGVDAHGVGANSAQPHGLG